MLLVRRLVELTANRVKLRRGTLDLVRASKNRLHLLEQGLPFAQGGTAPRALHGETLETGTRLLELDLERIQLRDAFPADGQLLLELVESCFEAGELGAQTVQLGLICGPARNFGFPVL